MLGAVTLAAEVFLRVLSLNEVLKLLFGRLEVSFRFDDLITCCWVKYLL